MGLEEDMMVVGDPALPAVSALSPLACPPADAGPGTPPPVNSMNQEELQWRCFQMANTKAPLGDELQQTFSGPQRLWPEVTS